MSELIAFSVITKMVTEIQDLESEIGTVKETWPKNDVIKISIDPDGEDVATEVKVLYVLAAMEARRDALKHALAQLGVKLDT